MIGSPPCTVCGQTVRPDNQRAIHDDGWAHSDCIAAAATVAPG